LYNGSIWTGNENPAFVEAVAIKGEKILQAGTTAAIKNAIINSTLLNEAFPFKPAFLV